MTSATRYSVIPIAAVLIVILPNLTFGKSNELDHCTGLAGLDLVDVLELSAESTLKQSTSEQDADASYCRIHGTIAPDIGFEVRLPNSNWNGKFLMQGCRAFCGVLMIDDANDALDRHYAVATTDMGHKGNIVESRWGYNNTSAEIDFAYRATRATAIVAKSLVRAFYDRQSEYNYYRGCSTGGRQGLTLAQLFPDDFDGIIAGAPVVLIGGTLNLLSMGRVNVGQEKVDILDENALSLLHARVLEACDALDGRNDGILDDPRACDFDPATLICKAGGTAQCLTPRQAEAAQLIYGGVNTSDGRMLAPGPLFGSELNWAAGILPQENAAPFYYQMAEDILRYLAFQVDPGPQYTTQDFDIDRDVPKMAESAALVDATNPDLRDFKRRGGKLIAYHGWQDESVTPLNTVQYYDAVLEEMGGADKTMDFFRLFMVPGMNHCGGGPAPWDIDWLNALEQWVEQDNAPDSLVGYGTEDTLPHTERTYFPYRP